MTPRMRIMIGLMSGAVLLASQGCAMLTAKTVGTFVATQVGKEAGKKVIKDIKEDRDEKKAAEGQQAAQSSQQPE